MSVVWFGWRINPSIDHCPVCLLSAKIPIIWPKKPFSLKNTIFGQGFYFGRPANVTFVCVCVCVVRCVISINVIVVVVAIVGQLVITCFQSHV